MAVHRFIYIAESSIVVISSLTAFDAPLPTSSTILPAPDTASDAVRDTVDAALLAILQPQPVMADAVMIAAKAMAKIFFIAIHPLIKNGAANRDTIIICRNSIFIMLFFDNNMRIRDIDVVFVKRVFDLFFHIE